MIKSLFNKILNVTQYSAERYGTQPYLFSIFAMLNYVTPFFIKGSLSDFGEQLLLFRILAAFLCFGLCFVDYWPVKWRLKYYPLYWYFTLCFCLPFLAMYTTFVTLGQQYWVINHFLSILLLLLLVDWLSFFLLFIFGSIAGYVMSYFGTSDIPLYVPEHNIYIFAYFIAFISMTALIFMRNRDVLHEEKYEKMQIFGSAIAHEVNSPLAAIRMLSMTFNDVVKSIKSGTSIVPLSKKMSGKKVKGQGLAFDHPRQKYQITLSRDDYEMLTETMPLGLSKSSQEARCVVEILLLALKDSAGKKDAEHSIASTVRDFVEGSRDNVIVNTNSGESRWFISTDLTHDFGFYGSKQLVQHVFYNLVRNALKYGGPNVRMEIWLSEGYRVHFRDNGCGISNAEQKHIFKSFYTKSESGTGIGLAFSNIVMKSIGGSIHCKSKPGKYTEFILEFPRT
jgi:signal transduction histidine kinase